jgi:LAS seventeen-binding protein 1/2
MRYLPAESPLNSASRSNAAAAAVPTNSFNNMKINNEPPPPAYNTPNPPSLPSRTPSQPAAKPEIARAIALYRYAEPDDCNFEIGDEISVFEYMNNDWWLGKNVRTGKEGVFPVNYVQVRHKATPIMNQGYGNEKANGYGGYANQQSQGLPPPGPSNPYDSNVPPMAVASQPVDNKPPGKGQENAKKIGKKLGNAAVFGAGATLGGKLVNSIF